MACSKESLYRVEKKVEVRHEREIKSNTSDEGLGEREKETT